MINPDDELKIPMAFPVCYIPLFSVRYYWLEGQYNRLWKKYFTAAINYPFLKIIPSFLNGRLAIDGGAADNIPIFPLLEKHRPFPEGDELDMILVLHFDARYDYRRDFTTDVPILDLDLSICNDFAKAHYDYSKKTICDRIQKAYDYGNRVCSRLFDGECTNEQIRKVIDEIFLEEHAKRQQNFSIDRLYSTLNIIGRALRVDAHCVKKLY